MIVTVLVHLYSFLVTLALIVFGLMLVETDQFQADPLSLARIMADGVDKPAVSHTPPTYLPIPVSHILSLSLSHPLKPTQEREGSERRK